MVILGVMVGLVVQAEEEEDTKVRKCCCDAEKPYVNRVNSAMPDKMMDNRIAAT